MGVTRFDAEGFLELSNCVLDLAFLVESGAEVSVRAVIALRDRDRMPEQGFTVLPIAKLLPRHGQAEEHRHATRRPEEDLRLAIIDLRLRPAACCVSRGTVLCRLSSDLCPLSSIFCLLPSAICLSPDQFTRAPDHSDQHPERRNVSPAIRRGLGADRDRLAHGNQCPAKPQPTDQQIGMPPVQRQNQRRDTQQQRTRQRHLPQRAMPGVWI